MKCEMRIYACIRIKDPWHSKFQADRSVLKRVIGMWMLPRICRNFTPVGSKNIEKRLSCGSLAQPLFWLKHKPVTKTLYHFLIIFEIHLSYRWEYKSAHVMLTPVTCFPLRLFIWMTARSHLCQSTFLWNFKVKVLYQLRECGFT